MSLIWVFPVSKCTFHFKNDMTNNSSLFTKPFKNALTIGKIAEQSFS